MINSIVEKLTVLICCIIQITKYRSYD